MLGFFCGIIFLLAILCGWLGFPQAKNLLETTYSEVLNYWTLHQEMWFIGYLGDFVGVVGDVEKQVDRRAALWQGDQPVVERQFIPLVHRLAQVLLVGGESRRGSQRDVGEEVVGQVVVIFEAAAEAVEERDVEADGALQLPLPL